MSHKETDSSDRISQKQACKCKAVMSATPPFGLSDLARGISWRQGRVPHTWDCTAFLRR